MQERVSKARFCLLSVGYLHHAMLIYLEHDWRDAFARRAGSAASETWCDTVVLTDTWQRSAEKPDASQRQISNVVNYMN